MYLTKTPKFIQSLFPSFTWRVAEPEEKVLYLTFDDGPIPEVTPWVLEQLKRYDAKATFFCVGDNVRKNKEIFDKVVEAGHSIGNHTFHHLSGWQTDNIPYFHDIRKCAHLVKSDLFRPPYGRIKPKQTQFLSRHYKIVMWDVLSGDFDSNLTSEDCYENVVKAVVPGSIVVFHDSLKAMDRLKDLLPKVLEHYYMQGYTFKAIESVDSKTKNISEVA